MTAGHSPQSRIGLIGVGTMGAALAANLAGRGVGVTVYDRDPARAGALAATIAGVEAAPDLVALAAALPRPRSVLLMVNAGKPVDDALAGLTPMLAEGDAVFDGGNSHWRDSERRAAALALRGIDFLGLGISGGEEGARLGPSIMAGGAPAAYERAAPLLAAIAARVDGTPCLDWFGQGAGAGHFVKMVHNGIEYAVMQIIAETWMAMERLMGLGFEEGAARVASWLAGDMRSYLLEITADLLQRRDPLTGRFLMEVISDRAGQKGTGQWTATAALEMGVSTPTLAEAVYARHLSAQDGDRRKIAAARPPRVRLDMEADLDQVVAPALDAATVITYAQGFALIAAAAKEQGWKTDLAKVARVWRGGCIVRADLLRPVAESLDAAPGLGNLLMAPAIAERLARGIADLRRIVSVGVIHGVSLPCMASALGYFDAYGDTRLWTVLVQAQRDRFGQHGFERNDRQGKFHLDGGAA